MVGCGAAALLCWQRAADTGRRGWRVGFAVAAAAGMLSHYYFVLPLAALAAAELVRTLTRRRIDAGVAAGFLAAGLALAAMAPHWGQAKAQYGAGFWAKVRLTPLAIEEAFHIMVTKDLTVPTAAALAVGVLAGAVAGVGRVTPGRSPARPYPVWEAVALAGLAAGPALGVAIGAKLTGAFYYRYAVTAVLGLAAVLAFAVGRACGPARWGCYAAALGFAVYGAAAQWRDGPAHYRNERAEVRATANFLDAHAAGGDVLFSSAFEFARVWHYQPDRRFAPAYLADPAAALRHTKMDTIERGVRVLQPLSDWPAVGTADVLARLAAGRPVYYYGPSDGWPAKELAAHGVRLEPAADRPGGPLHRLVRGG
jgi:hypothetical protein